MRKKLVIGLIILTAFLSGCAKKYDEDVPKDVGIGLEARWKIVDGTGEKWELAEKGLNAELDALNEYKELDTKNYSNVSYYTAMDSYIRELKNGLYYAKELQASPENQSYQKSWNNHQTHRSEILIKLNNLAPIVVEEDNKETFQELLANGQTQFDNNETTQQLKEKLDNENIATDKVEFDGTDLVISLENVAPLNENEFLTSFSSDVEKVLTIVKSISFSEILIQRKVDSSDGSVTSPGAIVLYEKDTSSDIKIEEPDDVFLKADAYRIMNSILESASEFSSLATVKRGSSEYELFNFYSGMTE